MEASALFYLVGVCARGCSVRVGFWRVWCVRGTSGCGRCGVWNVCAHGCVGCVRGTVICLVKYGVCDGRRGWVRAWCMYGDVIIKAEVEKVEANG